MDHSDELKKAVFNYLHFKSGERKVLIASISMLMAGAVGSFLYSLYLARLQSVPGLAVMIGYIGAVSLALLVVISFASIGWIAYKERESREKILSYVEELDLDELMEIQG